MKCTVLGATGFLGANLVHELVKEGYKVSAFGLPGSNIKYIESLPIEISFGDVTYAPDVEKAVTGAEIVFNVAGDTSFWKKLFERQRRVNIEGPSNVAEACLKKGVRRMIHTSTVDVLGFNPKGLADENWGNYNYANTGYNYADTKRVGERIVGYYVGKGLDAVIINPGSMIGAYDFTLQFGRLFADLRDGKVPGFLPGGAPWAHVAEVARAHIAAAEKGRRGERYICGGVNETYKTVFSLIAAKMGAKPPAFTMTPWMTVAYGYLMEFISGFTNKPPELNPGQARYMSVYPKYDSSKAEKELDFKCVPVTQMIDNAYDWYKENGFL